MSVAIRGLFGNYLPWRFNAGKRRTLHGKIKCTFLGYTFTDCPRSVFFIQQGDKKTIYIDKRGI